MKTSSVKSAPLLPEEDRARRIQRNSERYDGHQGEEKGDAKQRHQNVNGAFDAAFKTVQGSALKFDADGLSDDTRRPADDIG